MFVNLVHSESGLVSVFGQPKYCFWHLFQLHIEPQAKFTIFDATLLILALSASYFLVMSVTP